MPAAVEVEGLREFQSALAECDVKLAGELKVGLRQAAEPIRLTASALALSQIRNMSIPWAQMRVGGPTAGGLVYVAPKSRGTHYPELRRPNLAGLIWGRSFEPALAANENLLEVRTADVVEHVLAGAGF